MIRVTCRPLSNYPVPETRNRKRAPFHRKVARDWGGTTSERRTLTDSLDLLRREVVKLGASAVVIEADFREGQIRLDGWPKSDARPASPRVVISLPSSKHGPLRYPCDSFDRFEDNVRAVALALEALRMVDRYGVTRRGEQYAGWKALPVATAPTMSTEDAARAVAAEAGLVVTAGLSRNEILSSPGVAREVVREALRRSHPDTGGSPDAFHRVQAARRVLSTHHGVSL